MNEREAIVFILEEIKEQRRQDFEMYFEMRKSNNNTYERFLDRLREIDELDRELNQKEPIRVPSREEELRETFKTLPPARAEFISPAEMRVDRIPVEWSIEDTVTLVENFLKKTKHPVYLAQIQAFVELKFQKHWKNFADVMRRVMELSPFIVVDKSQKAHLYSYKEV